MNNRQIRGNRRYKNDNFQKLKGVMKGKGGAGAVAMGKALISNFTPGNPQDKKWDQNDD